MTQQQPQQPTGQQSQAGGQQGQTLDQFLPQEVSQVVYQLEQIESDAEWAHGQAMQAGDSSTAEKLADISQLVHLQKNLLLRESDLAGTVGQCTQQALQECSQGLQQSQLPGVQQVAQQAQSIAQMIPQASMQVGQSQQGMGGQMQSDQMQGGQMQGGQTQTETGGQQF